MIRIDWKWGIYRHFLAFAIVIDVNVLQFGVCATVVGLVVAETSLAVYFAVRVPGLIFVGANLGIWILEFDDDYLFIQKQNEISNRNKCRVPCDVGQLLLGIRECIRKRHRFLRLCKFFQHRNGSLSMDQLQIATWTRIIEGKFNKHQQI